MPTDPARVDQYDSRTFTRKGLTTRVVVREKPFIKSRAQRFFEFMRPQKRTGYNVVQGFELAKVMACIIFPVFMLLYWKRVQKGLPDKWESQFGGFQHRQLKEEYIPEQETDYFKIIDTFQDRREKTLRKKQMEVSSMNSDTSKAKQTDI